VVPAGACVVGGKSVGMAMEGCGVEGGKSVGIWMDGWAVDATGADVLATGAAAEVRTSNCTVLSWAFPVILADVAGAIVVGGIVAPDVGIGLPVVGIKVLIINEVAGAAGLVS